MHLESPYISPAQKGALDPANIRTPDDGTPDILLEHHDVLKIMVLAPELPGALDLIARLAKLGIVAAAGHSSAKRRARAGGHASRPAPRDAYLERHVYHDTRGAVAQARPAGICPAL